ncbi:unnamed protein product, partial [Mesorhabditis spiculigera]
MAVDFGALPTVIQHEMLRYMDLKSFFKVAITSKAMMATAKACGDKYWDVEIEQRQGMEHFLLFDTKYQPEIRSPETIQLLFHNCTVRRLTLYSRIPRHLDLRAYVVSLRLSYVSLRRILKRHKPIGKYVCVHSTQPFVQKRGLVQWMEASVQGQITILPGTTSGPPDAPTCDAWAWGHHYGPLELNAQLYAEEWLKGNFQMRSSAVLSEFARPEGVDPPAFFQKYPKLYIPSHRATYYRLKRADGQFLIVKLDDEWSKIRLTDRRYFRLPRSRHPTLKRFVYP